MYDLSADAEPAPGGLIHSVMLLQSVHHRSPKTTNKERILRDLLDDVLQGYRTAPEAAAAYGAQTRKGGRRRQFSTFAAYLDSRIRYATDPAVEQRLRDLLARVASGADTGNSLTRAWIRGWSTACSRRPAGIAPIGCASFGAELAEPAPAVA